MREPLGIELRGLSIRASSEAQGKAPGRARTLFEGLDLEVRPGGAAVLTGLSGTGKSSLLRAVMGFFRPDAGQVLIGGETLNTTSVWWIRRHMAYVPQEPRLGRGVVEEVLRKPFSHWAAGDRAFDHTQALDVFGELLLDEALLEAELRELSGGERQRVAIALALMLDRQVLVLDEPTSALDKKSRKAVSEAIKNREGLTLFASSHDDGFLTLADTVIDLSKAGEAK